MLKTFIKVTTRQAGLHSWKDAPESHKFLRDPHRHLFHISLKVEVLNTDRQIEFFALQKDLEAFYNSRYHIDVAHQESCEQIATNIGEHYSIELGRHRTIECEVSEDGENSGIYLHEGE